MEKGLKENRNIHKIQEEENNMAIAVDKGISERQDMRSFLASVGADFLLGNDIKSSDSEKFFQKLINAEIDDLVVKKVIDKFVKRYDTHWKGTEYTGEKIMEILDREAILEIGRKFMTGLIYYDKEQKIIGKILKLYPYYTLGDKQPEAFTEVFSWFLTFHAKDIDKGKLMELMFDLKANKTINTRKDRINEVDEDYGAIIFNIQQKLEASDIRNYLENKVFKNDIDLLKTMRVIYMEAFTELSKPGHFDTIKTVYKFLKKETTHESYIISEKAKLYIDILEVALEDKEMKIFEKIVWEDKQEAAEIIREFFDESRGRWNQYNILSQFKEMDMDKRMEYYYRLVNCTMNTAELFRASFLSYSAIGDNLKTKRKLKKTMERINDVWITSCSKDLRGVFNALGNIIYFQTKNDSTEIDSEEVVDKFFKRQNKISDRNEVERVDENYLFFEFSNIYLYDQIRKDFGVSLDNFSLYEQKQFFYFLLNKNKEKIEQVKIFLKQRKFDNIHKYTAPAGRFNLHYELNKQQIDRQAQNSGDKRFRTFLALEQNKEMGERILLIGERLGVEEADLIFGQYAKIVDMTENVKEELKKILKRQEIDVEEIDEQVLKNITGSVLLKAGELLVNFADRLERGEEMDSKKILEELKSFNEDLLFTFGTFKNFKGQLRLEDLEDTEFERVSVERYNDLKEEIIAIRNEKYTLEEIEKIADEDKGVRLKEIYEMFELYRKNYKDRKKFLDILLDGFVKVLTENKTDTHLYFVKQHGIIIGFNRYDIVGEDKKIMGSCNVMPSVQALSVGGAMFGESVDAEKEGYDLELATDAFSPVSLMYMKRGKFQVEKITNRFDPSGKWSFVMRRIKDGERNNFYEGKDLVKEYKKQNTENNQQEAANRFVVQLPKDSVQNNEYIRELVNERGFKITNILEREGMMYLGMEKGLRI